MPSVKRRSKSAKRRSKSRSRSRSAGGRKKNSRSWKRYAGYGALAGALGGGGYAAYKYKIFNLARDAGLSPKEAKAVVAKVSPSKFKMAYPDIPEAPPL